MTTGIEYTQCFTYVAGSSGSTDFQYFQLGDTLQTAGSVFVVKYFSISATNGITNETLGYSMQLVSTSSLGNTDLINVLTNNTAAVGANVPITVLNNITQQGDAAMNTGNQVILNQNYIGINVNMLGSGTFYATITYSLIPAANTLVSNFGIIDGTSGGSLPLFDSGSSTRILKSAIASNFDTDDTYGIQFVLKNGGLIASYLSDVYTLAPGDSVCYSLPLYLTSNDSLALYGLESLTPGGLGVSYYVSYIQEN